MRKPTTLTPTLFRLLMLGLMAFIIIVIVAGFYFIQQGLSAYAKDVNQSVSAASTSEDSISQLRLLELELAKLKEINTRASSIIAESQSYRYQDQVIDDLSEYATRSGVSISQFSFQSDSASPGALVPQTPLPTASTAPAGLKSTSVNISLNTPVGYTNLLKFLRSIEQNLTKMQISGVSLSKGTTPDSVSTGALTIEVYIK